MILLVLVTPRENRPTCETCRRPLTDEDLDRSDGLCEECEARAALLAALRRGVRFGPE